MPCVAGMEPPLAWQLNQDARSRQLQLVATAAAQAAAQQQLQGEGSDADLDRYCSVFCSAP